MDNIDLLYYRIIYNIVVFNILFDLVFTIVNNGYSYCLKKKNCVPVSTHGSRLRGSYIG